MACYPAHIATLAYIPLSGTRSHPHRLFHVTAMLMTLTSSSCFLTHASPHVCQASRHRWQLITCNRNPSKTKPLYRISLEMHPHVTGLSTPWRTLGSRHPTTHATLVWFRTTRIPPVLKTVSVLYQQKDLDRFVQSEEDNLGLVGKLVSDL